MTHSTDTDILLAREWPAPPDNPKSRVLLRRRERFLRKVDRYKADLDMVLRLIGPALLPNHIHGVRR